MGRLTHTAEPTAPRATSPSPTGSADAHRLQGVASMHEHAGTRIPHAALALAATVAAPIAIATPTAALSTVVFANGNVETQA